MKYNPSIVSAFFVQFNLPKPDFEHQFHPSRKWRFDVAFPIEKVAVEVDGGIWIKGGHNRGAQIRKDWEKRNTATSMGWRILYCEPDELCLTDTVELIRKTIYNDLKLAYSTSLLNVPSVPACCGLPMHLLDKRTDLEVWKCEKCGRDRSE